MPREEATESRAIDFDLYISKYLDPILEKKWLALAVFLVCMAFSFFISTFIKPVYISQAVILIEEPSAKINAMKRGGINAEKASPAYSISQQAMLESPSFAAEVLKILPENAKEDLKISLNVPNQIIGGFLRLGKSLFGEARIKKVKSFLGMNSEPLSEAAMREAFINELGERISINVQAHTAISRISGKAINKDVAPILPQSYADVWTAMSLEENKKSIRAERDFAEKQRQEAYDKFKAAQQDMIDFKRKYEIPGELKESGDVEIQLQMKQLQSNIDITRDNFDYMEKILMETRRLEAGIVANIKLLSMPAIPQGSSTSEGKKIILGGVAAGLILGVGMVLLLDILKGIIRTEQDVTDSVQLPILGYLPKS